MPEAPDVSIQALRRLARGLLFDRHAAEDVVQEAWLAALRSGAPESRLGAWLTEAVKRLARNRRRAEARLRAREELAARAEAQPASDEHAERIDVLHRLLDALHRLPEPYRTAVMLRYLDDRTPRAIARRTGVPLNTARTHLRRGIERLRRDLDGERGEGRRQSLAALAPLVGVPVPGTAVLGAAGSSGGSWIGGILVTKKIVLVGVLVLVLIAGGLAVLRESSGGARSAEPLATLAPPGPTSQRSDASLPGKAASNQREVPVTPERATAAWILRGHAFRHSGEAFPGLALVGRVFAGARRAGIPLLEQTFTADALGDFAWVLEPPAELVTLEITPSCAQCVTHPIWSRFLPGDPAPDDWTVRAEPLDVGVRGVVRTPDGAPVPGAEVRERGRIAEQSTVTDAQGHYLLRTACGGDRSLRVRAPGFAQATITLDVQVPGDVDAPEVVLAPELRVMGRVVDESGLPLAGVLVEAAYPFFDTVGTTDAEGAFELGTLDPGAESLGLTASREGFASASIGLDAVARQAPVELTLVRGARLHGRVLAPDGTPVVGAWVALDSPGVETALETFSGADGRFALEHVPCGKHALWVWRAGWAQLRTDVTLLPDAVEHEVELVLEHGHALGGLVLGADGAPLPWAMVYAEDADVRPWVARIEGFQTHCGADGRFRMDGLPDIPLTLGALHAGYARLEQEVHGLDRDDLVLRLVRTAGFAGRVVDDASGAPVSTFVLRVGFPPEAQGLPLVDGFPASWSGGIHVTDPHGEWRLEDDFKAGQVLALTIEAPGYAPVELDVVSAVVDPDPADLVVRLAPGTVVRGRVVERGSGAPIAGARVRRCTARLPYEALATAEEHVPEALTDAAGAFELTDVPRGAMSLAVEHPDWALALVGPFEVSAGALPERWIELDAGARVHGRLLDGAGGPLAGETVLLRCLEGARRGQEQSTTTDAQGMYALNGLVPGVYHLHWERHLGGFRARDLQTLVVLGEREERAFDLRPLGHATLTGSLAFDGELPGIVQVLAHPLDRPRADWPEGVRATFAEHGSFTLTDLEPGRYVVSVHLMWDSLQLAGSALVEVPEQGTVDVRVPVQAGN